MDAIAWVGIAGIGGTLLGALLAPLLAERMRRESARLDRLVVLRLEIYADLLRVTARLVDNAMTWSAMPLTDLKETDDEELNHLVGRVRAMASKDVYERYLELSRRIHEFNRLLWHTRQHQQELRESDEADDLESINQRMTLADFSDTIRQVHMDLEAAIRTELGP